jgi:type VI protein secretion system component Hcp
MPPNESVSFAFGKVTFTYTEQDEMGNAAGDHVGIWDVRTGSSG